MTDEALQAGVSIGDWQLIAPIGEGGAGHVWRARGPKNTEGALKLILGERADRGLIRTGATSCVVDASFELGNAEEVNEFLEGRGFEPCE